VLLTTRITETKW